MISPYAFLLEAHWNLWPPPPDRFLRLRGLVLCGEQAEGFPPNTPLALWEQRDSRRKMIGFNFPSNKARN